MRKKKKIPKNKVKINRAIKVPLYPTPEQEVLLAKTFGCCRFIWNNMLSDSALFYKDTGQTFIPEASCYKAKFSFLKEVDKFALGNTKLNLEQAYKNFFKNPKHFNVPVFKTKKNSRQSYTTNMTNNNIEVVHKGVKLPKLGIVKAKIYRNPGKGWVLKSCTVSKTPSGKYFCSLLYEIIGNKPKELKPDNDNTLGLDYSSHDFYVDSNGAFPENKEALHFFRNSEVKLAKLQHRLSRMQKGSKNYMDQLQRIRKLHEHVANQRIDFAHKTSRKIANSYDFVCLEDIDLAAMSRTLKLGKSTLDNGFGRFRDFLQYKLQAKGGDVIYIDKWYPSSKTCNSCGYINKDLQLRDRIWLCPDCGNIIERDANAATNIKEEGIRVFYTPEE